MGGAAAKPAEEEAWPKQAGNDGIGLILLRIQDYDDDYAGIVKG